MVEREMEPSRDGIVKDILLKTSEGLKQGLICNGSWFKWEEEVEEMGVYDFSMDESEFWDGLIYKRYDQGDREIKVDTQKLLKQANEAERCIEGEVALQTANLGGTQDDYHLAKGAILKYLNDRPMGEKDDYVAQSGECRPVTMEDGTYKCVANTLFHWNDVHAVPTKIESKDQAIEIGGRMAEVVRAAADRL